MSWKAVSIVLLVFTANELHQVYAICNVTALSSQLDTLLAEYDRESPPALPVLVELGLDLRHVNVLEKYSSVRLLGDLRVSWKDSRLAWNATDWGCESGLTPAERLWLPDITIMNAASSGAGDSTMRARLNSDGSILWITRVDVTVPISMQMYEWPSDIQTCTVKYGSRAQSTEELDINVKNFEYAAIFESSSWDILNITVDIENWSREGEERNLAIWQLKLQRHAPAHSVATGAVLVASALILVASMFLEPSARAPLLACASFTAAIWLISALIRLPPSGSTPVIMSLMCALCVSGALWCACAAVVMRVAKVETSAPRSVHGMVAAASRWCKLVPLEGSGAGEVSTWAAAARLIDVILLAALALTVFIILCLYI